MTGGRGRFLSGSTMGHVVRMTLTGAAGITFVFLVDAANLFWVSRLGDPRLMAAIGFSFAIQFFVVSIGVGMMIAATALVSRAIGAGERGVARDRATSAMILTGATLSSVALGVVLFRHALIGLAGAEGETAQLAARYLMISMPSLAFMSVGLVGSGALRAEGDGRRAMFVTLTSGGVAMLADPFLIYWLGLDGAALGVVLSRMVMATVALRFAIGTHDLLARPSTLAIRDTAAPFFRIAVPALLTQMAAPFGNYLATGVIAGHGDTAVAAWAVVNRLTVVSFGGLFALGGAVSGIFGQNYGARMYDRVRSTYRDAVLFCVGYTAVVWAVLVMVGGSVAALFALDSDGQLILSAFTHIAAGFFVFIGAHYVSNAAFNAMGRPLIATAGNWLRDGVLLLPFAFWFSARFGAVGVVYAQAAAGMLAGIIAALWGWHFVAGMQARETRADESRARAARQG